MFSNDNDRNAVLMTLVGNIDLKDFSRWDAEKVNLLREELRDLLRKPGSASKITTLFDVGLKFESAFSEDLVSFVVRLTNLSLGESLALAYCLCYSQHKIIVVAAKKFLKFRLGEVRNVLQLADMSEDIKGGLQTLVQSDEDLRSSEGAAVFLTAARGEAFPAGGILQGGVGFKLSNPLGSSTSDLSSLSRLPDMTRRVSLGALLEEYGPQVSATPDSFRKVFLSAGVRLDEEQLAGILIAVMPKSPSMDSVVWNYDCVAEVLQQECRGLNWTLVVKSLDHPRLIIRSENDFQVLARLLIRISGAPIPAAGLVHSLWSNTRAQFAMLALCANTSRSVIDFSPFITQDQLFNIEGVNVPPNFSWVCQPLYLRLLELANSGLTMEVLEVLLKAASMYPEYVLIGLSQTTDQSVVRAEVIQRLLPAFTGVQGSRPSSLAVMRRLYSVSPDILFRLCYLAFKRATKAAEILSIENIVKSLGPQYLRRLETDNSLEDLIGYWCIKADRQEMNLEDKLLIIVEANPKYARILLAFVKQHMDTLRGRSIQQGDGVLSIDSFATILRCMQPYPAVVPVDELKSLVLVYNQFQQNLQMQSTQQAGAGLSFPGREASGASENFEARLPPGPESEEVENLANAYFQKIYTTDITIPDVIALLRQFKSSAEKKEQELFRCMVHNLFDEYRFFHKYPEKELVITARLFGSLIQHQLVSSITLGIALRYVLEALRKDPELGEGNDKMFRFGQISLEQFRSRLAEWPQYCSHLIQIPHLSRHNPDLFQEAQRALSSPQQVMQQQHMGSNYPQQQQYEHSSTLSSNFGSYSNFANLSANQSAANTPAQNIQLNLNSLGNQFGGLNIGTDSLGAQFAGAAVGTKSASLLGGVGAVQPLELSPPSTASLPLGVSSAVQPKDNVVAAVVPERVNKDTEIERMLSVNQPVPETGLPNDSVRDTVHFIINNVAKSNIESKGSELKEALKPELFGWFANYLVEKRISSQPNLHPLYLTLLDIIDNSSLNKLILDSTLYNVTKFLSSPQITSSTSERSVLRHFGMWLGQITLARNKPLLQRRIDLKNLIFWGYETGRLIAVCSFVAKVIEGVKESKVFRPPNPWLMAVLGVLRELFEVEDLKLNIKFEVQVLCKNINVKIEDVPKTNLLITCQMPVKDQKNPDFIVKQGAPVSQHQQLPAGLSQGVTPIVSTVTTPQPPQPSVAVESVKSELTENVSTGLSASENLQSAISHSLGSVVINPSLTYFTTNPNQRRIVAAAVERGIKEISQSAVERSVALAVVTTRHLVLKDFASEGSESLLRQAAHNMVCSLAGSLSLAICKEPLRISIGNHLRTLLAPVISDQTVIEQIVQVCSNDNIELGSALIEKAATDKAVRDIDESLKDGYAARKAVKESGEQTFVDAEMAGLPGKYPAELQDMLRLPASGLSASQLQLYDAFQKASTSAVSTEKASTTASSGIATGAGTLTMSQALEAYQVLYNRLDQSLKMLQTQLQGRDNNVNLAMLGDHEVVQLIRELVAVTQRTQATVRNETAMTFSETIFNRIFESISNPFPLKLEVCVAILEAIREACGGAKAFNPDVISWLAKYSSLVNDDLSRRVYRHVLLLLIRAKLFKIQELDNYFTINMEGGTNMFWLELTLYCVKQSVSENLCTVYDFTNSIDAVQQMKPNNLNVRKTLQKWLLELRQIATAQEEKRSVGGVTPGQATPSATPVVPPKDLAAKQQVTALLDRWLNIWTSINEPIFAQYLQLLHQYGVTRSEESAEKFFKLSTEICCEAFVKTSGQAAPDSIPTFTVIDALSKLFLLLVRVADKESGENNRAGANFLNRILSAVVRALCEDHDTKKNAKQTFDQRPYLRLLSNLCNDLGVPVDDKVEPTPALLTLVSVHAQAYLSLQPSIVPGFAFAWLQLISKKTFLPHLVRSQKGWAAMHKLLSAVLMFLQPFLKIGFMGDPIRKLYKGVLRVLLVLLHDFPEFLCDFHVSFCDIIPLNCVQLRNLVLSAFPRSMRLPDPFTPNLKLETVPEIVQSPRILIDYVSPLGNIRAALENYLTLQQPADLPQKLLAVLVPSSGTYNSALITSVVLFIGSMAIGQQHQKAIGSTPSMEIFKYLLENLDSEGRYMLLNSIVNQLRYPNNHTWYFSYLILTLFSESSSELVQEQITRVLLERLIAHRPHPWGLLVTFIELIKAPKYSFWRKAFTRSSPDIERIFESIARSCIGPTANAIIQQQQA